MPGSTGYTFVEEPLSSGIGSKTNLSTVTANAAVTSDQQLQEISFPAGYFNSLNQAFWVYGSGIYSIGAAQTPTLTFKAKLCTVSGCGSGTVVTLASITTGNTTQLSSNNWNLSLMSLTNTTGATGNFFVHGVPGLTLDIAASSTAADTVYGDGNTANSGSIDLTAALFLDFTVATSTGSGTNAVTQHIGAVLPQSNPAGNNAGLITNVCTNNPAPGAYTPTNTAGAVDCLTAGTYTLPTSVTTISANNVTILCTSKAAIIQRGSGASGLKFTGNQSGIVGCTLDDNASTSTARFIEITGNDNFVRDNIHQNPSATSSAFPTIDLTGSATRSLITNNVWLGTQVDPCIMINSASTASGTVDGATIEGNRVATFGPSAATTCIGSNQVSGSTVINTVVQRNFIKSSTGNAHNYEFDGQVVVQNSANQNWRVNQNESTAVTAAPAVHFRMFGQYMGNAEGNIINTAGLASVQADCNFGDLYNFKVSCVIHGGANEQAMSCVDCENNDFDVNVDNVGGGFNAFTGSSSSNPFNNNIIRVHAKLGANAIGATVKGNGNGKPANYNKIVDSIITGNGNANSTGVLFDIGNSSTGTNNSIENVTFHGLSGAGSVDININNASMSNTKIGPGIFFDSGDTKSINDSGTNTIFADTADRATLTSPYTNATTTFSSVTGLNFAIAASQTLTAKCTIIWQGSASTTGPKYQWTGPASPTAVAASAFSAVTATTITQATATAFSSAMANAGTITTATNFVDTVTIGVINGTTSGTVQLQAAANGAGTLTIQPGSYCTIQ